MARFVYLLYEVPDDATIDDLLPYDPACQEHNEYGTFTENEYLHVDDFRVLDDDDPDPTLGVFDCYRLYLARWIGGGYLSATDWKKIALGEPVSPLTFEAWKRRRYS